MFDLKPLFFVVCRLTAHFFVVSRTAKKTVFRNKNASPCESCPPDFVKGVLGVFCPVIPPPCSGKGVRNFADKIGTQTGLFRPLLEGD